MLLFWNVRFWSMCNWPFGIVGPIRVMIWLADLGWAARALDQASEFGAIFDVAIDNLTRQTVWSRVSAPLGAFVASVEWFTFACTSCGRDNWKERCFEEAPGIVTRVVSNHFRNPWGALAITGLHFLPLCLLVFRESFGLLTPDTLLGQTYRLYGLYILGVLVAGRLLSAFCEFWLMGSYISFVVDKDMRRRA